MITPRRLPKIDSLIDSIFHVFLVVLAVSLVAPPASYAQTEKAEAEPLPPTRLEIWIKDGDGPAAEKASIPLVEEGTFAVRFVIEGGEIPGIEHQGDAVGLRWMLVVSGDVGPSVSSEAGYAVILRPTLHTFVDGDESLAEMSTRWEKALDVEKGEVVEIEIPTSPGATAIIPSDRMAWQELPQGIEVVYEGEGLAFRMGELTGARELSLVLRLGPER